MALNIRIFPVTAYEQNCSLLWDDETQETVLVDVGGESERIWQFIQDNQLNLKEIWITHGHIDHVGGVVKLLELANQNNPNNQQIPVIGPHQEDLFLLEDLPNITREYAKYGFEFSPSFVPTRWLNEGEQVSLGNGKKYVFDIMHIPGHTPGHVVFYCEAEKLLIGGDVLFKGSVGRTDFPRGNTQDLLNGIKSKLYILPDDVLVIAGHGETTTIGHEKQHNPYVRG